MYTLPESIWKLLIFKKKKSIFETHSIIHQCLHFFLFLSWKPNYILEYVEVFLFFKSLVWHDFIGRTVYFFVVQRELYRVAKSVFTCSVLTPWLCLWSLRQSDIKQDSVWLLFCCPYIQDLSPCFIWHCMGLFTYRNSIFVCKMNGKWGFWKVAARDICPMYTHLIVRYKIQKCLVWYI